METRIVTKRLVYGLLDGKLVQIYMSEEKYAALLRSAEKSRLTA